MPRNYWTQDVTPDRAEHGHPIDRTAIEEVCQLLGHDPAEVLGVLMGPLRVDVMLKDGPATVLYRHVIT